MSVTLILLILAAMSLILAIGVIGGLMAGIFQLNRAVKRLHQGDYDTPISIWPRLPVLNELATGLDQRRARTKQTVEALSQTNIWLETLFESIDDGILTYNTRGMITSFNKAAEVILGKSRDEVYEGDIDQVIHLAQGGEKFTQQLPAVGGQSQVKIQNQAGEAIDLTITRAELRLPNRKTTQTALVFRDITETLATQNLRSYFLGNISHEFRTPLSALNASVELLLDEIEDLSREEISQLLSAIHLSVTGLQTLIDNLLESSSIEAGQFRIRPRKMAFHKAVTEAERVMKPLLRRRKQSLAIHQPENATIVKADPQRLTQVLVNLLSNASKYSPIEAQIDLSVEVEEADLYISVEDEGRGISAEEGATLFQRFTRVDDQDEAQYGMGLGLSVVKAIIEEHGGQVGCEPRSKKGSRFWFRIPLEGRST